MLLARAQVNGTATAFLVDAPGIGGRSGPTKTHIYAIVGSAGIGTGASATITLSWVDSAGNSQSTVLQRISNSGGSTYWIPFEITGIDIPVFGNSVSVAVDGLAATAQYINVLYAHQGTE